MSDNKTKWLFDKTEDLGTGQRGTDYTETLQDGMTTDKSFPSTGFSEQKTTFMGGGAHTEIFHGGSDEVSDPVVGWLVVIKGPGLGNFVPLGAGMNNIGRDEQERAPIPFGDSLISAKDHLRVVYDGEERVFLVVPGSGKNISKLAGKPIYMPEPLENYSTIQLSKETDVRFVAFCNDGFDWSDVADEDVEITS